MNYSQSDEQQVILDFFGDYIGKFLDIGALDGVWISNTRALLEKGWHGVYVEPDPRSLAKLVLNTEQFAEQATIIAAAAISSSNPWIPLLRRLHMDRTTEWASSVSKENKPVGITNELPTTYLVPAISMSEIYREFGPFDFVSIDTEGTDFELLKALPEPPKLLCIEPYFEEGRKEMKEYLKNVRSMEVIHDRDNLIAKKI